MKVILTDSFFKSLKRMQRHNTWWYKIYETIRYNIPNFFKNLWFFRKEIYEYRTWDYHYSLIILKRSLEGIEKAIRTKSGEVDETRLPKVEKIQRVIKILDNNINSSYISISEEIHGKIQGELFDETEEESKHNKIVFDYAHKLEVEEWDELWSIIKGNDDEGSDMRGWWNP